MSEATDDPRLAARALAERWEVPSAMRAELIKTLYSLATSTDPKVTVRAKQSAIRALFAASKHNVEAVKAAAAVTEIDALMARLDQIERALDDRENEA